MPQAFLDRRHHGGFLPGLDIDDPVGMKSRLRQGRSEQVATGQAPQHRTVDARGDARREQGGRSAVDRAVASAGQFMQRTQRQSAARQSLVDLR